MSRGSRWLRNLSLTVVLVAVVGGGTILAVDNQTPMTVRFLNQEGPKWPVFWWLYLAFAGGVLLGLALCTASLVRGRWNQRSLRRSLRQQERKLDLRDDFPHQKSPVADLPRR